MNHNEAKLYHNQAIKKAEKASWSNLAGSEIGLAISMNTKSKLVLVITKDTLTALTLQREFNFFKNPKEAQSGLFFPSWETLPYDHFSPHEDVVSERLLTLGLLGNLNSGVIFVDVATLMQRLPPRSYVEANSFVLALNDEIDIGDLRQRLEKHGYTRVTKVMERGEFALRGSIIDVFPTGSSVPYRIDLLDTSVNSIKIFDVDSQLSSRAIESITVLPAREFPMDDEALEVFAQNWRAYFGTNPLKHELYQNIINGTCSGIEYYLPLFFEHTETLFDYLSSDWQLIAVENIETSAYQFWGEIEKRYEQLRHDVTRPILEPDKLFIHPIQLPEYQAKFPQNQFFDFARGMNPGLAQGGELHLFPLVIPHCFVFAASRGEISIIAENKNTELKAKDANSEPTYCIHEFNLFKNNKYKIPFTAVEQFCSEHHNARLLFIAQTKGRKEEMLEFLDKKNMRPQAFSSWSEFRESKVSLGIAVANIESPLHVTCSGDEILLLTEAEIYGKEIVRESEPKLQQLQKIENLVQNLTAMQVGSPVVHADYGVGRYLGLERIKHGDIDGEFLVLEYANQAKLYVPVTSMSLVTRYTGVDPDSVSLSLLGSMAWEKTKKEAKAKIHDTAVELLELYAKRSQAAGFKFIKPEAEYERFVASFPFADTVDQKQAVTDALSDMTSGRHMDRLICGDVGFGKTEVAMRAVFLAVYNSKQVAILAPTTILAQQHYDNFCDRFAAWPFKIGMFSRFRSPKEHETTLADLHNGKLDIVIGTHKLLQKNVVFKNLGLLVIDEEHRFGVRQKEQIKKMAIGLDVLALTATPIPRTLNMAFAGVRDFSIIATPPAKRLSIKTIVHEHSEALIKEAVLREIMRGGQVYFLHNNIATINKTAEKLKELIPMVRLAIAHGQMHKNQLELIMKDFYHQKINLLVCTTIIESGLDVPTANTIIIDRADRFGLAQLHQIRGRVGRSVHQAYAYLMTPPKEAMSIDAKRRLEAVAAMKDLGTGFALATHDLEIRGAGELLGEKQSGIMQSIGFTLYMQMLNQAVKTLKKGKDQYREALEVELDLQISALIPDSYVDDINLRLVLYKRIADADTNLALSELKHELIDRFGKLPEQTQSLFKLAALRLLSREIGIKKLRAGPNKCLIEFTANTRIDPGSLIKVVKKHASECRFSGPYHLELGYGKSISKLEYVEMLLNDIKTLF